MANEKVVNPAIKKQLDDLDTEINTGWLIYGRYMDAGKVDAPEAVKVREILNKLAKQKADLLIDDSSEAISFIHKHSELLNVPFKK